MKLNNLFLRIILIFTVLPFLFAMVFFVPYFNYIGISIISILFSITGTWEVWKLFCGNDRSKIDTFFIMLIAISIPVIVYLECVEIIPWNTVYYYAGILIFIIFTFQSFYRNEKNFTQINKKISAFLVMIFYPGLFFSYTLRFSTLPNPTFALFIFIVSVFCNDICAYVAGRLLGKNNRNVIPISPKKSLAGFIGGFLSSIVFMSLFYAIKPIFFGDKYLNAVIFGAVLGAITIIGDLNESAMKRSASIKDSGNVLGGRGGILDNIDSLIFSAPPFYFLVNYMSIV